MNKKIDIPFLQETADEIILLYEKYGSENYDGEPVSQMSHMVQSAMLARESADQELILGSFLHDIGHLLKHEHPNELMGDFGVRDHEGIGAAYLIERGFSKRIVAVVQMHVSAKRFLVATDEKYASKLSMASTETLKWQGGPMNQLEVNDFKSNPYFEDIIKVRLWDEKAKVFNMPVLPLSYFKNLIFIHLKNELKDV